MAQRTLDASLDIIQESGLEITLLDGDLNIIQKLDDEPNDVGGLTAAELKAKFDEAGNVIKTYINETLVPELLAADAVEAQRAENEDARQAAEEVRQAQEAQRQELEAARQNNAEALEQELRTGAAQAEADLTAAVEALETRVEARDAALCLWEDYDPQKTYAPGNKVAFEGSSYVNIALCTGVAPTGALPEEQAAGAEHWLLIAQRGRDGKGSLTEEAGDARYLRLDGGIMTGALTVLEPESAGNPATKAYADARETAAKAYADGLKQATDGNVFTREETLTAQTAAIAGFDSDAVPDDVLQVLLAQAIYDVKLAKITVLDEDENPVDGVKLSGVTAPDGSDAVTDDSGAVLVAVTSSVDVGFHSNYIDLEDVNQEIGPHSDKLVNNIAVTLPYVDVGNFREITLSGSYKTRKQHNALVCCVGAGQDGNDGNTGTSTKPGSGGLGGESGKISNHDLTLILGNSYEVLIGANGSETSIGGYSSINGTKDTVPLLDNAIKGHYGGDGAKGGTGGSSTAAPTGGADSNTAGGGGGTGAGYDPHNTNRIIPGGESAFGEPGQNGGNSQSATGWNGGNGGPGGGGGGGGGGGVGPVSKGGKGGKGGPGILLVKILD